MISYKDAGVDVEAGYESVKLMKDDVKRTFRPEVVSDLGGFGGLFSLAKYKYEEPILVSGTDGVGTKLKIAFGMNRHDTIGIDCVAMCVNDIVCSGAEPLFFLDYVAVWKNIPKHVATIVKGVSDGCVMAGCALVGGETAEMPGIYMDGEYDLAGFSVGIVDKKEIIDGKKIVAGDVLIGLASSGLHSNGFSLVRKLINPTQEKLSQYIDSLGKTLGEELLTPTKIYVKSILEAKAQVEIKGISHITGGGFIENIPRIIPDGLGVTIQKGNWPILPIFDLLKQLGGLDDLAAFNTFNMGIGMVVIVSPEQVEKAVALFNTLGESAYVIGSVEAGQGVTLC
ncbi:MAG: phosphoribosylformylglycinamidine cyclo-ligase [Clostridia bacterium]